VSLSLCASLCLVISDPLPLVMLVHTLLFVSLLGGVLAQVFLMKRLSSHALLPDAGPAACSAADLAARRAKVRCAQSHVSGTCNQSHYAHSKCCSVYLPHCQARAAVEAAANVTAAVDELAARATHLAKARHDRVAAWSGP